MYKNNPWLPLKCTRSQFSLYIDVSSLNLHVYDLSHNWFMHITSQWRHNGCDCVSNHQPHDCLLSRFFRHRSKKTSKLRVTGICTGNSPVTGEFPAQEASNAENISIWWRHHGIPQWPRDPRDRSWVSTNRSTSSFIHLFRIFPAKSTQQLNVSN